MSWAIAEHAALVASAALFLGCAAIGFKFVASPYFKGYASAAVALFILGFVAASFR